MQTKLRSIVILAALSAAMAGHADTVSFTKLTGVVGAPGGEGTAVYKANLGALSGSFAAISISDMSGGFGGATGAFSGFDLDAIKLSTVNCATAACAQSAAGMSVFNFISGVVFSPGTQRAPLDPKLFGTGPGGTTVNNAVATLGVFDGYSSTATPDGFLSLGDNGSIAFNLSAAITTAGLFLYIGEVGDNGEIAGSNVEFRRDQVPGIPEPGTYLLMLGGIGIVGWLSRRQRREV